MLTITNEDNMALMARYPDKYFDLAIVDPPYGIREDGNLDLKPKGAATKRKKYNSSLWDCGKPTKEYWDELMRVSKNQIVWGGNYFTDFLPPSRCWIIWDKRGNCPGNDFADCEMAWTSFSTSVRKFTWLWNGMLQQNMGNKQNRIHPTEKPFELYKYLLKERALQGDKILDTHLGSGSIAIACHDYGFDLTACELDKEYFDAAMKRINNHMAQTKLF
jgi:site-specific DNA-methyltransferase (adenine-specific)